MNEDWVTTWSSHSRWDSQLRENNSISISAEFQYIQNMILEERWHSIFRSRGRVIKNGEGKLHSN